jgi:hypothetical protein
MEISKTKLPKS